MMWTASCCCCSAHSASSRCCVDYSRLTELQRHSTASEHRPSSATDQPSPPVDERRSSYVDVQSSPILHDDDADADEAVFDGIYDSGTSSASRPTVLRLTTFKPSLQPPPATVPRRPRAETIAEDVVPSADQEEDSIQTPGVDMNHPTTKPLPTTSTASNVSVVSTVTSAVLERLQPDLLPLMSSSAVVDETAIITAMTHTADDLP